MAAVVAIWRRLLSWFLFENTFTPPSSHGIEFFYPLEPGARFSKPDNFPVFELIYLLAYGSHWRKLIAICFPKL